MKDVLSVEGRIAKGTAGDNGAASVKDCGCAQCVSADNEEFVGVDDIHSQVEGCASAGVKNSRGAAGGRGDGTDGAGTAGNRTAERASVVNIEVAVGNCCATASGCKSTADGDVPIGEIEAVQTEGIARLEMAGDEIRSGLETQDTGATPAGAVGVVKFDYASLGGNASADSADDEVKYDLIVSAKEQRHAAPVVGAELVTAACGRDREVLRATRTALVDVDFAGSDLARSIGGKAGSSSEWVKRRSAAIH